MASWIRILLYGRRGNKENWKRTYIREYMPRLIKDISCNALLLSVLCKHNVLGEADLDKLETYGTSRGKMEQRKLLLEIISSRHQGYEYLATALHECKQTGALYTLLRGIEENLSINPFCHCGIDIDIDNLLSQVVNFGGASVPLMDVCSNIRKEQLVRKFQSYLNVTSFIQLTSDSSFILAFNTIPTQISYFIERSVSQSSILSMEVFRELLSDVFLIQDIELFELTQLARSSMQMNKSGNLHTDKSGNQIESGLNVNFIQLEDPDHFEQLSDMTSRPIHWVRKQDSNYLHVKSSGKEAISRIKKFLTSNLTKLSIEQLVHQSLITPKNCPILLYDSPGSGKSVLLVELAHRIKRKHPCATVCFVRMPELVKIESGEITDTTDFETRIQEFIINAISKSCANDEVSNLSKHLLRLLVQHPDHEIELFVDGYDEVSESYSERAKLILMYIIEFLQNIRVFITTRQHNATELENMLGVAGYNIVPFHENDQISFIVNYWCTEKNLSFTSSLSQLADSILKSTKRSVEEEEREITGLPLQCKMLADLYCSDARKGKTNVTKSQLHNNSLYQMYKNFVTMKFDSLNVDENERRSIYSAHLAIAISWMFPENPLALNKLLEHIKTGKVSNEKVLRVGILESNIYSDIYPRFVHRTFAEYLAGEFLSMNYTAITSVQKSDDEFISLLFEGVLLPSKGQSEFRCNLKAKDSTFLYFFCCSLYEHGIGRLNLASLKEKLMNSKYYSKDEMASALSTAAISNNTKLFEFLMDLYFDTGICSGLGLEANNYTLSKYFNENLIIGNRDSLKKELIQTFKNPGILKIFLVLVIGSANHLMVKIVFQYLSNIFEQNMASFSPELKKFCFTKVAQRGSYQIFEYFYNEFEHTLPAATSVLHDCLRSTYHNSTTEVNERIQILKLVVHKTPALVNNEDWHGDPPILVKEIHPELIKCLHDNEADITATNENGSTIFHLTALYLSASEFQNMIDHMLQNSLKAFEVQYTHNSVDKFGLSILHYATCSKRPIELLKVMIEKNYCDVAHKNYSGETFLHWFPEFYDASTYEEIVTFLGSQNKAHVFHVESKAGHLPIHDALREIDISIKTIETFSNYNVDFSTLDSNGLSPLFYATISNKSIAILKALICAGADIMAKSYLPKLEGDTFFHILPCKYDANAYEEMAEFLSEFGKQAIFHEKNEQLQLSLHKAALNFDVSRKTLELLQRENVEFSTVDQNGVSVLGGAVFGRRSVSFLKALISMGADVMLKDKSTRTIAHYIPRYYSQEQYHQIVEFLINSKLGGALKITDCYGLTPVDAAVQYLHLLPKTVDLLSGTRQLSKSKAPSQEQCENFVDVNSRDNRGNSILFHAVRGGQSLYLVKRLIDLGADVFACNDHNSTLVHMASSLGYIDLVKHFVGLGCDINALDNDGDNALQCVIHDANEYVYEIADYLIQCGVDKTHVNKEGKTAYMYALDRKLTDELILDLLRV